MANFGLHQSSSRILEIPIAQGKFKILCYIKKKQKNPNFMAPF